MNRKALIALLAAVLLLGAIAFWLVGRDPPPGPTPGAAAGQAPPVEIAQERPPPRVEQRDLDRLAEVTAQRDLYYSLRGAFQGGKDNPRARARMDGALRLLWPAPPPRWSTACRNRVCQVTAEGAPRWQEAMRIDERVREISDRLAWDPDGLDPAAYVLLVDEGAKAGAPTLQAVEQRLLASPQVRSCLGAATEPGTVEYELLIDSTGITYLRSGTADVAAQSCVEAELADIITTTPTPAKVKSESRRVVLQTLR